MNKAAIQRFAIQARTDLIDQVSQRAYQYGITKDGYGEANAVTVGGRALNTDEQRQRKELVEQIRQKGYTQVMEEVAYTWFNRFIALRFMEVNNYLPSHIRIFSDSTGAFKPEILNDALHLDMPGLNMERVAEYIEKNQTEDLYRYLLLTQCNALNDALPQMFEKLGGFSELLLPNNILKQDSVLGCMVVDIPEEDWTDQVQIIGWLYQYYNSELKDDTFALLKKNVKITKERVPSATQLFTPDWIVRYMVENSLGRIFIDKRKNEGVFADGRGADEMTWKESEDKRIANEKYIAKQMGWKYYLPEAEQTEEVKQQLDEMQREYANLDVKEIKVLDPSMGSGHILVYAFDVLMQIYEANGYSQRDAAQSILENNLYGLDIDDRAAQLAYFAVMMKARQYDRRIFSRGIQPHVYAIVESSGLDRSTIDYFTDNDPKLKKDFGTLVDELRDAKEYGSILNISQVDFAALYARINEVHDDISIFREVVLSSYLPFIHVAEVMAQKYDVVVTNPPYMSGSGMGDKLLSYVQKKYKDEKADIYACFITKSLDWVKMNGFVSLITMETWMFLNSLERMRVRTLCNSTIHNMIHMPYLGKGGTSLGINFGTAAYVLRKHTIPEYQAEYNYIRYYECNEDGVPHEFPVANERHCYAKQSIFSSIPSSPIAYWISDAMSHTFNNERISSCAISDGQTKTGDNNRFLRLVWEVAANKIGKDNKWAFIAKGGNFRRWYGNIEYVIDWSDSARHHYRKDHVARIAPEYIWFREGVSWNHVTSIERFAARFLPSNMLFETAAPSVFFDDRGTLLWVIGYLNSIVSEKILKLVNPTMCTNVGDVTIQPMIKGKMDATITEIVTQNIELSKTEWDSFECSWDFTRHPLSPSSCDKQEQMRSQFAASRMEKFGRISWHFDKWQQECEARFNQLKTNEEKLNRIFIDIYGLQDELTPEVEDKDVTVRCADLGRDIRSLISYAVGCMFGRYSLDADGLAYAGGEWDASKYSTYIPDKDNIIPICDDDYFDDDITGRFVKWVETVYGSETLEENLKFIADALGGKGTPREVIRSYFINDFYADHLKIYQKRPIYWLFDSGKKNGFKALIYMHRYQSDLLARMRTDYVHEQQERYRTQLMHIADAIDHASASERVKLTKQQKKLQEQSLEIQKYEEKIHHLADQNIQIDLDDGVNHNYELFAEVLAKRK
jgi:type II restriction/modification system DNA methylase subunit YeeA